jgi:PKHD-type hydroxylase
MLAIHTAPDAFTPAECDRIVALAVAAPASDARLVGQVRDHNLRRADLVWVDELTETGWIMDRLIDVVRVANRTVYGFDLTEFAESPQIARYAAEREGHFDWHSDIGEGVLAIRRKLTLVVQLSDPGTYLGGALELRPGVQTVTARIDRGAATLFPSYLLHRVAPVTDGIRHSLTVWAHGPAFR